MFSYSGSRRRGGEKPQRSGSDNLFTWTIALLLLVGLAAGAWIASYYVFGHPEEPFNYQILDRLGQIEELQRFELTKAPKGEFLTAREMFERFGSLPGYELANRNEQLVRNYIRNYSTLEGRVPYLIGSFSVLDSFALSEEDVITSGAVVLAQATDFPGVLVEHLYPSDEAVGSEIQRKMRVGTAIRLKKTLDLAALLHVTKLRDGRLLLTVMPLLYGSYALDDGSSSVSLRPPERLNLAAGWPIVKPVEVDSAETRYNEYLRQHGLSEPSEAVPTLVPTVPTVGLQPAQGGIDPHATPAPALQPSPSPPATARAPKDAPRAIPVAPAIPITPGTEQPQPVASTAATPPPPVPPLEPAPTPPLTWPPQASSPPPPPPPAPEAITPPPSQAVGPGGIPLKPFLPQGSDLPLAQTTAPPTYTPTPPPRQSAAWRLYPPGRMPRGRLVDVGEAARMPSGATRAERVYLGGDFVVTASQPGKAILRSRGPLNLPVQVPGITPQARIIVEFPQPGAEPGEGTRIQRDGQRPFQILSVEKGSDGVVNIYAREVTSP